MGLSWFLFAILMAFDGVFLAAVGVKYLEVKRASRWPAATGKVISSRSEARKVDRSSGAGKDRIVDTEIRNFAAVRYSYDVAGTRRTGDRIGLAHDVGNFQVAEKLKKYPAGAIVTVYYDPQDPRKSVLERDLPARAFEIALLMGGLVALAGIIGMLLTRDLSGWLTRFELQHERGAAALFVAIMAVFMALFGYHTFRRGAATYAWPKTEGLIASSKVEKVRVYSYSWSPRRYIHGLRDRTVFSYAVGGVKYTSDTANYGGRTIGSIRVLASRLAGRFTAGETVEVYYNPEAPEQAVLLRGAPGQWLIWTAAAVLLGVAAWLAGQA